MSPGRPRKQARRPGGREPGRPGTGKTGSGKTGPGKTGAGKTGSGRANAGRSGAGPSRGTRPQAAPPSRRGETEDRRPRGPRKTAAARGLGGEQVEGRQAVRELLLAGRRRIREVLIAEDDAGEAIESLQDIVDIALDLHVPVRTVSRTRLLREARTEAPQGVLAHAAPLPEVDLEDLARPGGATTPFLVAVDGVTDPGNLGALIRSAECAGVTGIVLPRHRAVHVTPAVTKASAGAVEHVPMTVVGGLPTAINQLRDLGVWVIGLDAGGPQSMFELQLDGDTPVCLVLGSEGAGLSRLVRQRCDLIAHLPLLGHLASLNVAAAGTVACFEVARRRLA